MFGLLTGLCLVMVKLMGDDSITICLSEMSSANAVLGGLGVEHVLGFSKGCPHCGSEDVSVQFHLCRGNPV